MIETVETNSSLNLIPQTSIDDYLSASRNKDPLLYPGERPESSYMTDGEAVFHLQSSHNSDGELTFTMDTNDGKIDIDTYLADHDAPAIGDRIPILAFGANVSPSSLATKFGKVGRPDALMIPTVYAELEGHDVVWSGPGLAGNPVAILYRGEETQDTTVQAAVNFLTPEQVLVMHASEVTYELSSVDVTIDGEAIKAFYYAGRNNIYLRDGKPVAIESIPAKGRVVTETSATGVLEEILADPEIAEKLRSDYPDEDLTTPRNYVELAKSMPMAVKSGDRLKLKTLIQSTITEQGNARFVEPGDAIATRQSWANPSTLPTLSDQQKGVFHHDVYRLPSQDVGEWADPEKRAALLRSTTRHLINMSSGNLKFKDDEVKK